MPDDRDQLFEKALARQLRADSARESWCLDPETLAAYQERALSSEEMSAAKSHIVSCLRCQQILAQLEATEEIADGVSHRNAEPESVPALAAAKPVASGIREEVLVAAASARSTLPRKVTSLGTMRSPSPSLRLGLAVPAGALAAGLLLLIALREFRPAAPKQAAEPAQVAENRAPVPAPEGSSEALRAVEKDKPQLKKQEQRQALQRSAPAAAPMLRSENALRDEKKDFSTRISPGEAPQLSAKVLHSPPMIPRQHAAGPNVLAGQAQAVDAIQQSAPAITGRASQQVELAPKAVPPQAPALDDSAARTRAKAGIGGGEGARNAPAAAPAPPAPSTGADNLEVSAGSPRPEVVTKPVAGLATYSRTANKIGLDIRIPAPGGKKIWSVGPNGQILYSTDSGHSWLPQASGVSSNLTGGSAPSDKVCWIVGAAGTLLRTTDGGNHWQAITTPITGDLGGIQAADAQHAFIWDATNHLRYQSTDGGTTWKPSANE
jgi:Photosynthesis system II assembly factor YCF48